MYLCKDTVASCPSPTDEKQQARVHSQSRLHGSGGCLNVGGRREQTCMSSNHRSPIGRPNNTKQMSPQMSMQSRSRQGQTLVHHVRRSQRHTSLPVELLRDFAAVAARVTVGVLSGQGLVQDIIGRQVNQDSVVIDLHVKGGQVQASIADTLASLQVVGVFVDRASNLRHISGHANQAAREDLQLLVGARILCGVPLVRAGIVENSKL
mmetsp:Transcript_50920/g.152265  ORF Transcript_50920/g.152265 Transcript_50920/m.152265 type:complete len:208 (-) Transcript_50920:332-955(-)